MYQSLKLRYVKLQTQMEDSFSALLHMVFTDRIELSGIIHRNGGRRIWLMIFQHYQNTI